MSITFNPEPRELKGKYYERHPYEVTIDSTGQHIRMTWDQALDLAESLAAALGMEVVPKADPRKVAAALQETK